MNVDALTPTVEAKESFRRSQQRLIPDAAGCYVLTTFDGTILYLGLTVSLCRRMGEHLDSEIKTGPTAVGRAVWFHWLRTPDTNKVERSWMNMHLIIEGILPVLNSVYSPTST